MMDRGKEIRELKLGASFTHPNNRTGYHTVKYDFKPASVDAHKEATLETGSNNQVTVTVPHLDGAGTPNTIFKGNQRDYTKKECVLIFNRETNEIILEKLCSNIAVKKTRADTSNKLPSVPPGPPPTPAQVIANQAAITKLEHQAANTKLENQTTRHSTKTRVSTGIRKNVLNFVPKHSPLQGSPSYPHKSPQQAPSWNANSSTSTLPSIPSLLDDNFASNQPQSSVMYNKNSSSNNNSSTSSSSSSMQMPKASSAISTQHLQQQQQTQQQQIQQQQQQSHQMAIDDIGVLSSSESSSDSNDSDSDSDSGDSIDNHPTTAMSGNNMNSMNNMVNHRSNISNINNNNNNNNNGNHKKGNHLDNNSAALLSKDLCLSDSNSDSDF